MLIELLLVIAVAVIIIFLGLERYRAYYKSMQFDLVQNDIVTIREKLNKYYNKQPCNVAGKYQGALDKDIIPTLGMLTDRAPYISQYHAYVHDTGAVTKAGKPVYHIEVSAEIAPHYYDLFDYLTKRLHGTRHDANTIYWSTLPNTLVAQPKRLLWVMDVSREQFKNLKNMVDSTAAKHSYCFR